MARPAAPCQESECLRLLLRLSRSRVRTRIWSSMSIVEVHPRKERMGAAIKELESNVSGYIPQHGVVAHPEAIFGVVAVGIPGIDSGHGPGIGRDQSGKRKE